MNVLRYSDGNPWLDARTCCISLQGVHMPRARGAARVGLAGHPGSRADL